MSEGPLQPTLIGYFPLRTVRQPLPPWLQAPNVVEIASAGGCISVPPKGWMDFWRHNAMGVFNSVNLAWSVVDRACGQGFDIYAYAIYPVRYVQEHAAKLMIPCGIGCIPAVAPDPLPKSFRKLGYDAVSIEDCGQGTLQIGHAPLSCNHMATEIAVNQHCLLEDCEEAFRVAQRFSVEASGVEPGEYAVVETYRAPPP